MNLAPSNALNISENVPVECTVYEIPSILDDHSDVLPPDTVEPQVINIFLSHSGSFHTHSLFVHADSILFEVFNTQNPISLP